MTRRGLRALSSAVEHFLDMEGVRGSIPLAPTIGTHPIHISCSELEPLQRFGSLRSVGPAVC